MHDISAKPPRYSAADSSDCPLPKRLGSASKVGRISRQTQTDSHRVRQRIVAERPTYRQREAHPSRTTDRLTDRVGSACRYEEGRGTPLVCTCPAAGDVLASILFLTLFRGSAATSSGPRCARCCHGRAAVRVFKKPRCRQAMSTPRPKGAEAAERADRR